MNYAIFGPVGEPITMPGRLLGSPRPFRLPDAYGYDADAQTYIEAVEAADKQKLEVGVRVAMNSFVVGLKADGLWDRIGNALLMCGARTILGATVPLIGPTTTVSNFVSGDYARKTGIVSSAYNSAKIIQTNFTDPYPQDDFHLSAYATTANTTAYQPIAQGLPNPGTVNNRITGASTGSTLSLYARCDSSGFVTIASATGLLAVSRAASNASNGYVAGATAINTRQSVAALGQSYQLFGGTDARLAFYSCGLSINMQQLELRVSKYVSDIKVAF